LIATEIELYRKQVLGGVADAGRMATADPKSPTNTMYDRISKGKSPTGGLIKSDVLESIFSEGKYLKLATYNTDHFENCAARAYQAGHMAAMTEAVAASKATTKALKEAGMTRAFIKEGMAAHYLSDKFAAGHIRMPRGRIFTVCGADVGGVVSKAMHDEDNFFGLYVKDAHNNKWLAFGDGRYGDRRNAANVARAAIALTEGLKEVVAAYRTGAPVANGNGAAVLAFTPVVDEAAVGNHFPMLKYESSKLMYRDKTAKYHDVDKLWCLKDAAELLLRTDAEIKAQRLETGAPPKA